METSEKKAFLENYQTNLVFKDEGLRASALEEGVNVISNEIGEFISFYLKNKSIGEVVEIGSGFGYSTKFLHILLPQANIISIERYLPRYERAKSFLVSPKVSFFNMEAQDYLDKREESIDLLFLDGSKPHYVHFLERALLLMPRGSILIADNILARGLSYDLENKRRHRTLQKRMKEFLDLVFREFHATIIDIDDGLLIGEKL